MMRTNRMLATAGVSLLAIASPAMAQDTAAKDSEQTPAVSQAPAVSDVIIVEARRRGESVQDVPLVVQAVTSQNLADLNIREFKDVQSLVPGLSLDQSANGIGAQATMRGIAFDVNASGNNGTIEFYLNDTHLSPGILFMSMYDVAQIEVLRGPQGTLRGRASPSGSVTVTTVRPDMSQAGGYGTTTINDLGGWNFNGALNVPVIEDMLAIRIAGLVSEDHDSRITSINNPSDPSRKTKSIRASVAFDPFDSLSLFGMYMNTNRDVLTFDQAESMNIMNPESPASPVTIRAKDRQSALAVPRLYEQNSEIWNWGAEYRAFGQKINYVGAYNKQRLFSFDPSDKGAALSPDLPLAVRGYGLETHTRSNEEFHEIRISSDERVFGMFDYVVGYLYNELDAPSALNQGVIFPLGGGMIGTTEVPIDRFGTTTEKSFFGNITAHIGDATEISGGLRRIKYHSEGGLIIAGNELEEAAEDRTRKATIYSASIKHNFTEDFMAYASFGTSWRPGSATNAIILRENAQPDEMFSALYFPSPEKSESYEIGFKSTWLDDRLRVNLTAFHQDFKNYAFFSRNVIFAAVDSEGVERPLTAAPGIAVGVPAKVDGVEAEIAFQASDRWNLGLVAAYAKSKVKNGVIPCNDYNPADGVPDSLPSSPTFDEILAANGGAQVATCGVTQRAGMSAPFSMTFQTQYEMPLSNSMDGYARALVTYSGKSQNDPTNVVDDIKAHGIVNLFAGIRDPEGLWDLGVYGKNIFDVLRVTSRNANAFTASGLAVSSYRGITINNPREFGVNLRVAFGSR